MFAGAISSKILLILNVKKKKIEMYKTFAA